MPTDGGCREMDSLHFTGLEGGRWLKGAAALGVLSCRKGL